MGHKMNIRYFKPEVIEGWKEEYEAGVSLNELSARESAKGRGVSGATIGRRIEAIGVVLRSQTEATLRAIDSAKATCKRYFRMQDQDDERSR